MIQDLKNLAFRAFLYAYSLYNTIKVKLGLLSLKQGLLGYYEHEGVKLSSLINSPERVKAIRDYNKWRPDDVLILTYPKAGTHFTGDVIASIYKEKGLLSAKEKMLALEITPFKRSAERMFEDLESLPSPRIMFTHLPWNLLPTEVQQGSMKVIHVLRNPKDVICSYYPFQKTLKTLDPKVTWAEFVSMFAEGNVLYGGYFDFLKQWYPHRNSSNLLNLEFESMKQDLDTSVREIAKILNIELTDEEVERVVEANTFENKSKKVGKGHIIYRKGKSGGWRSEITVEQNAMLDEWIEEEMKGMEELVIQYR